jgi:hypothetical protein
MINGHATLHELLHARPGTVLNERRYLPLAGTFDGTEYRATERMTVTELRSRMGALEEQIRETDRLLAEG